MSNVLSYLNITNFILWVALSLFVLIVLNQKHLTNLKAKLLISRVGYGAIMLCQIALTVFHIKGRPFTTIISDLLIIAIAKFIEDDFKAKSKHTFTQKMFLIMAGLLLLFIFFETCAIMPTSVY